MSTRDMAINSINLMDEEQLAGFVSLFQGIVSGIPNEETIVAMQEAEDMINDPNSPRFNSVEDLFEALRS